MAVSLLQIVYAIGRALNDLNVFVASGGAGSTVIVPALINGDATASKNLMNGVWAYAQTANSQSRGTPGGYDRLTGTVGVDRSWAVVPAAGDNIWFSRLFPIFTLVLSRRTSYAWIANESARYLWFEHQIALPTVPGAHAYSLAPYGRWLTNRDQLLGLLDPPVVSDYPPQSGLWRRPSLTFAGGSPTLRLPSPYVGVGETFNLLVKCPVNEYVNGADSPNGMVAMLDTVQAVLIDIETVGIWIAARTLALTQGPDATLWAKTASEYEGRARALAHWFDREAASAPAGATPQPATTPTPALTPVAAGAA